MLYAVLQVLVQQIVVRLARPATTRQRLKYGRLVTHTLPVRVHDDIVEGRAQVVLLYEHLVHEIDDEEKVSYARQH